MTDTTPLPTGLTVQNLTAYLEAAGWAASEVEVAEDVHVAAARSVVWTPPQPEHADLQVALPSEGVEDSVRDLYEAARVVAYVEGFTLGGLLDGIAEGGADTLSVRLLPDERSGVAPLALAQESITALRMLIVGSAAALTNDALVLPSRRPALVEQYAAEAQVSTRPGSFIWDVALPLTVDADKASAVPVGQGTLMELMPQPFGRRVTNRIATVATNALAMAQRVEEGTASIEQFNQTHLHLGNALELDALARLGEVPGAPYQLRLVQSALVPRTIPTRLLSASPAQRARLSEAAEFLRTTQPQQGITVEGFVVRLFRDSAFGPGDVTIHAVLDDSGRTKACVMHLAEEDYAEAHRAHLEGLIVVAKGDLRTAGTRKSLINVTQFHVVNVD